MCCLVSDPHMCRHSLEVSPGVHTQFYGIRWLFELLSLINLPQHFLASSSLLPSPIPLCTTVSNQNVGTSGCSVIHRMQLCASGTKPWEDERTERKKPGICPLHSWDHSSFGQTRFFLPQSFRYFPGFHFCSTSVGIGWERQKKKKISSIFYSM